MLTLSDIDEFTGADCRVLYGDSERPCGDRLSSANVVIL